MKTVRFSAELIEIPNKKIEIPEKKESICGKIVKHLLQIVCIHNYNVIRS